MIQKIYKFYTQYKKTILIAILIIAGILVYINSLPNGFVWDDEEQIVKNQVIQDPKNFYEILTSSTFYAGGAGLSGGFYRPIVSLSYLINYQIFGPKAWGFHLFQLIFHIFNVILVFLVLERILFDFKAKFTKEIAFLSALIFAVHPANVESVSYIGSTGEILYTFFILLGFFVLLLSIEKNIDNQKTTISSRLFYWGIAFCFLGFFAKENAMVIFLIIALYFLLTLRSDFRFWIKYYIPISLLAIGTYLIMRLFGAKIPLAQPHFAPIANASLIERILTLPYEIFIQLKNIFFPKILAISQHFVVSNFLDVRFWGSFLFLSFVSLAVILFIMWQKNRDKKIYLFFLLWFIVSIFPTLNIIIPLDMSIAERWLYFPSIGLFAFLSIGIIKITEKLSKNWQIISYILLAFFISILSFRTISRNKNWKDGLTLYSHDIQYSKNSFDLENNYGVELFRIGQLDEAEEHFKNSIKLQDKWTYPHNNLGAVYERKGDFGKAKEKYQDAIDRADYYLAYQNLAGILLKMNRYDEAKEFLESALKKFPRSSELSFNLAVIYYKEGKIDKALSLLKESIQNNPQNSKIQELYWGIQNGVEIEFENENKN